MTAAAPAGLLRRLAAMTYDGLLVGAVLFVASIPLVYLPDTLAARPLVQLYLLGVIFLFFAVPWVRGGQTLGMRAWRVKVVACADLGPIGWGGATRRFVASLLSWACLGLGFAWVLVDPDRLAWHDRLSGTRLIVVPRIGN